MTRFQTASPKHVPNLYHWQRFVPEFLTTLLRDQVIWCSDPASFNDPWDCKPYFSSDFLGDQAEFEKHIQWYGRITRESMPDLPHEEIARRQNFFRANPQRFAKDTEQLSCEMWRAIARQYRVYCLGPDVHNALMWAHYADSHKGVCLEFSTKNAVICCALRVEYVRDLPAIAAYSEDIDVNLIPLLTKCDVWSYEREYRLVAQENNHAVGHDTLVVNKNFLALPERALTSIIVGCQGPFEQVRALVHSHAPSVSVRRAVRIPDRYELSIE
jgi:hypothetical protein